MTKKQSQFIIKRLWWFFKLEKKTYIIGILALIVVAVLNLLPPFIMGRVIDTITQEQIKKTDLLWHLMALILAALAMYGLRYVWRMFILATSYRLGNIMRSRLFAHFLRMSPSFYQTHRTGDLMAHATNDINALTMLAGGGVMSAVDASITALVTLATMFFTISWQMTLVAVLPLPVMAFATSRLGKRTHRSFGQSQAAFSELNNKVQESVSSIKVTKSFGYQKEEVASFQAINQASFEKNMTTMRYDALFNPVVLLFIGASYTLTLVMGSFLIEQGQVTVGNLVTFITYLDMLVWPLMAIGFLVNITQRGSVSYNRIEQLLAEKPLITDPKNPKEPIKNGQLVVAIDQFSYDGTTLALQDIHFTLEKGETLGLVGPTGSGKTSLLKLLLREYDVTQGSITLNGHAISDYRLQDLRCLMGYAPQDAMLFARTIADNIRFGDPTHDQKTVEKASQLTQVYEDIMAMPKGFETLIGERGISLSGGQKQRIAMSRAMILDPEILLLDDSLSAVDAKTEHAIIENLKSNRQGKTTLITAHRLSAVVHADKILVLKNGRVIESGRHQDLLASGGWYAKTYATQQIALKEEREESHVQD